MYKKLYVYFWEIVDDIIIPYCFCHAIFSSADHNRSFIATFAWIGTTCSLTSTCRRNIFYSWMICCAIANGSSNSRLRINNGTSRCNNVSSTDGAKMIYQWSNQIVAKCYASIFITTNVAAFKYCLPAFACMTFHTFNTSFLFWRVTLNQGTRRSCLMPSIS